MPVREIALSITVIVLYAVILIVSAWMYDKLE